MLSTGIGSGFFLSGVVSLINHVFIVLLFFFFPTCAVTVKKKYTHLLYCQSTAKSFSAPAKKGRYIMFPYTMCRPL